MSRPQSFPRWMTAVLYFAGVYNIAWGIVMVLFPLLLFTGAGIEPPNYPSLARGIGMMVGAYGVGYLIAATDPVTHWPVVFVGLLGKVCGPIGFVWAASHGELPWQAGWVILVNDIAWWAPFIGILMHAKRVHQYS